MVSFDINDSAQQRWRSQFPPIVVPFSSGGPRSK